MYDIILTHGYFLSEDEKEQKIMRPHPPLGLLYLSSYLKQKSLFVKIIDSTFSTRDVLYKALDYKETKILGIYTNFMTRGSVLNIIKKAKENNIFVILGGPEATNYKDEYLNYGADVIVNGEGEETLYELLVSFKNNNSIKNVLGISYKQGEDIITNENRILIKDINTLPWPDREEINIEKYLQAWNSFHGESCVTITTARGCPYHCTWCSHSVYGYSHRRREPSDCVKELQYIVKKYKPTYIWYVDDVFTINYNWLYEYSFELKKANLKVPFETITRADRLTDEKVLDTLKEMGCFRLWIGAESCSQRLLDHMKRNVTVEQVFNATKKAQERGITVGIFLMWGYADENVDDIEQTVKEVARINPDIFFTTIAYPIKGTEYYKQNEQNININFNWEEGSDRDIVLENRKSSRYYRFADGYLRSYVKATRLIKENEKQSKKLFKKADKYKKLLFASKEEKYYE